MSDEKGMFTNVVDTVKSYFQPTVQATTKPIPREASKEEHSHHSFPAGRIDPNLEGLISALSRFKKLEDEEIVSDSNSEEEKFNKLKKLLTRFYASSR